MIITQKVADGCAADKVSLINPLSTGITAYEIEETLYPSPAIEFNPFWVNSVTGCPQTWSLFKRDSSADVGYDASTFSISTSVSGKVTVYTDDLVTYEPP